MGPLLTFRRTKRWHLWPALLASLLASSLAAVEYENHVALSTHLKRLATQHGDLVRVTSHTLTAGKRDVWLVELGSGGAEERLRRPAVLVVAGIEGNDLVGSASAMHFVEHLVRQHPALGDGRNLLDQTTIYVFPRVNPDAAESFFSLPRAERTTNYTPTDEDHDGLVDEDGPEDLNGDGLITSMRIQDPEGEFILDPTDSRLLMKADKAKGEKGAYKLLVEGVDTDRDQQWNEDPAGGVNLNRNFPFAFQFFAPNAGWHPVCEVESRAVADFIVAHPNIGIVFTFGSADNVLQAPKGEPGGKRPPSAISEADLPFYRELGQVYRESLGLKKELNGAAEPGSFPDWIYYHRGRLSLSARPWSLAAQMALEESPKGDKGKGSSPANETSAADDRKDGEPKPTPQKEPSPEKRNEEERSALKWFDKNEPSAFHQWREFQHPDFPGQKVEIGGWVPFSRSNPPTAVLEPLVRAHAKFLTALAERLPRIGIRTVTVTPLGSGIHEVKLQVENRGYLPTALTQGSLTREVLRTRVVLDWPDPRILGGQKTTLLGSMAGSGGMEELRYVLRGTGSLRIEVISALGGVARQTVELKEAL